MVKDWAAFLRFLRLAAMESGQTLNYAGVSNETGLSQPTVKSYYQLLEDMFVGFSVPAWSGSPRKHLLSTPRFLIFDLGLRHAAAGLRASRDVVRANPGPLFEQWVGIELDRCDSHRASSGTIRLCGATGSRSALVRGLQFGGLARQRFVEPLQQDVFLREFDEHFHLAPQDLRRLCALVFTIRLIRCGENEDQGVPRSSRRVSSSSEGEKGFCSTARTGPATTCP